MKIEKNTFLVLDTETADLTGSVYDVGFVVCHNDGKPIAEYNALVQEIFTDADKMMGAFYARKLFTHYAPMLDSGEIRLQSWRTICDAINMAISAHGVNCIVAYNAAFDFRVMRSTHKMLGNTGPVLTAPVRTLDLWRFACVSKLAQKTYREIATAQGWVSDAGNLRTGAEYAFRFCSGDYGFIEDHTALSDARIEAQILAECLRQKKRIPYNELTGTPPWKLVNSRA